MTTPTHEAIWAEIHRLSTERDHYQNTVLYPYQRSLRDSSRVTPTEQAMLDKLDTFRADISKQFKLLESL